MCACPLTSTGNVKTISGQFKKSDLCSEHRLNVSHGDSNSAFRSVSQVRGQPRDLRKIDSRIPNLVPTILVRKEAILVSRSKTSSNAFVSNFYRLIFFIFVPW